MKYHFCFQIFATWANQQHYKTSLYDMWWWFGGSVGIEQFWWRILDKTIFTVSTYVWFCETVMSVASVPCVNNLWALHAWVIRWHVSGILSLAEHWHGTGCSEQSRLTSVLPINHVIQMPQCLSVYVNHDCWKYDLGCRLHNCHAVKNMLKWLTASWLVSDCINC